MFIHYFVILYLQYFILLFNIIDTFIYFIIKPTCDIILLLRRNYYVKSKYSFIFIDDFLFPLFFSFIQNNLTYYIRRVYSY